MIWLAWRHIRTQTLVLFGVLIALIVLCRVAGAHLRHQFAVVNSCVQHGCTSYSYSFNFCEELAGHYLGQAVVYALPVITGMFWGAPLVARELSTGTARTAWTQSVTRTRWLTTKLAITGTASIAATALLSLSATWWFTSFDNFTDDSRFDPMAFDVHGLAPIGYAAFGFTLGVLAGMIWRRTIPAMVTTLVTFVAARIAVIEWIRPNFQTPRTLAMSLNSLNASLNSNPDSGFFGAPPLTPSVNDWVISNKVIDASGHAFNAARACYGGADGSQPSIHCLGQSQAYIDKLRVVIKYQPANRYWPFQIYETVLYTAAAAVLIGVSFWLLRRRSA
jgi:hypothetical protein